MCACHPGVMTVGYALISRGATPLEVAIACLVSTHGCQREERAGRLLGLAGVPGERSLRNSKP